MGITRRYRPDSGPHSISEPRRLMETPIRSPDEISRLYAQLADQISAKNEAEVRRVYRELLHSGEPLGAIVGTVMSSINRGQQRRGSGRPEPAVDELPDAQRVPAQLGHSASEVPVEQPPGADVNSDGPDVEVRELRGAGGDDRPLDVWPAVASAQTEAEQAVPEAPAPEPATADGAADLDFHEGALTATTDDPPLVSAVGGMQSARPPSDLQLLTLAMQRAQSKSAQVTPEAEAPELAAVSSAAASNTEDEDLAGTRGRSAPCLSGRKATLSPGPGLSPSADCASCNGHDHCPHDRCCSSNMEQVFSGGIPRAQATSCCRAPAQGRFTADTSRRRDSGWTLRGGSCTANPGRVGGAHRGKETRSNQRGADGKGRGRVGGAHRGKETRSNQRGADGKGRCRCVGRSA